MQVCNKNTRMDMGVSLIKDNEVVGSKMWLINMYQEQLDKFAKLGLGKQTEHGVTVTKKLIDNTQQRLDQLTIVYDRRLTPQAIKLRIVKKRRLDKEKLLDSSTNGNGTTTAQGSKGNGNTRHASSKS